MINGVVTSKIEHLENTVRQLESLQPVSQERLADWILRSAVERNLQVAVETMLDICHRLIAMLQGSPATSGRQALERCQNLGVLKQASLYFPLVGLRNIVVHEYQSVDASILEEVVNSKLGVLHRFTREVQDFVAQH